MRSTFATAHTPSHTWLTSIVLLSQFRQPTHVIFVQCFTLPAISSARPRTFAAVLLFLLVLVGGEKPDSISLADPYSPFGWTNPAADESLSLSLRQRLYSGGRSGNAFNNRGWRKFSSERLAHVYSLAPCTNRKVRVRITRVYLVVLPFVRLFVEQVLAPSFARWSTAVPIRRCPAHCGSGNSRHSEHFQLSP